MGFLAPIAVAAAGAAASAAVGGGIVGAIVGGVVAAGLGMALAPDPPELPSLDDLRTQGIQDNISNPAQPIPVIYGRVRVGGSRVFVDTTGANNEYLHLVMVWGEGEINDVIEVYFDDLVHTDPKFSGLVDFGDGINAHLGSDTQAADSQLVARSSKWTTNHRLLGTAYTYIRLKYHPEAFPRVPIVNALVEGKKVYDVRDGLTKFSRNPALCIYDYMTNTRYGMGIPAAEIDTASFAAAANECDVVVDGQAKYTCDGVVNTDRPTIENLKALLSSCRGMIIYSGGKYRLLVDAAEASSFSFTEDNIVGQLTINWDSRRDRKNRVRAQYFSETRRYQPDFVVQDSSAYRAEDNGTVLEKIINLPFTTNYKRAQRIAEQELKQSRFSITCEFSAQLDGLRAEVGDVVTITHSTPGWVNKQFRVVAIEYDSLTTVKVRCREYDGSVYSGDPLPTESTPPAPTIPRPRDVVLDVPKVEESVTWIDTFENDVDGWTGNGATIAQDADAAVGSAAAKIAGTGSAATDHVAFQLPASFWYAATVPGRRIRVQFWHKQPSAGASSAARVEITNGTDTAGLDITPGASWQSDGFLFAPSVIGTGLTLKIYPDRNGTNGAVLIDNITAFVVPDLIDAASISQWIDSAAIGTAYIADAAIKEAKIADLNVTELKIANGAVTNYAAARDTSGVLTTFVDCVGTYTDVLQVSITIASSSSLVVLYGALDTSSDSTFPDSELVIKNPAGSIIGSGGPVGRSHPQIWIVAVDSSPVAGLATYTLSMCVNNGGTFAKPPCWLYAVEYKK